MPRIQPKMAQVETIAQTSSHSSGIGQAVKGTIKAALAVGTSVTAIGWCGWGISKVGEGISCLGSGMHNHFTLNTAATAALTVPVGTVTTYAFKKVLGTPDPASLKGQISDLGTKLLAFPLAKSLKNAAINLIYPPVAEEAATTEASNSNYLSTALVITTIVGLTFVNHKLQQSLQRDEFAILQNEFHIISEYMSQLKEQASHEARVALLAKIGQELAQLKAKCQQFKTNPEFRDQIAVIERAIDKYSTDMRAAAEAFDLERFEGAIGQLEALNASIKLLNTPETQEVRATLFMQAMMAANEIRNAAKEFETASLKERVTSLQSKLNQLTSKLASQIAPSQDALPHTPIKKNRAAV